MRYWPGIVAAGLWFGVGTGWGAQPVALIRIDGTIGPATASYLDRAVRQAAADDAACLVIQLDTPGGLLESTKEMVQTLYASTVPTVIYVAPPGATAASAGCFITLAADIAAMAPGTSIGAAHPISLGGPGETAPDEVMKQKMGNYAASSIEAIAAKRHRNVEWARSSVLDSASIRAEEALDLKVVDLLANDQADLLKQLDGREVNGKALTTVGARVIEIPMLARERVFQLLWRPEVMFILMLIAIYGIIGELSNPGAILPGVAGAIALTLSLYMMSVLPVNITGVVLLLLAIGLFVIDIFAPTHGVLTAGGIVSFFLGALMLFDRTEPAFRLSLSLIVPAALVTGAFFLFVVGAGLRAQLLPVKMGREAMVGRAVTTLTAVGAEAGRVLFDGEDWQAFSEAPIAQGQPAEIVGVQGLALKVKPKT